MFCITMKSFASPISLASMSRPLSNAEIANIFFAIADHLAVEDIPFKPRAYQHAAEAITTSQTEIADIYNEGGLKALNNIPGVGTNIALKIEELMKTGHLRYFEKLKKKMPVDILQLRQIEGVGPKMIKSLWEHLHVKNIADLEAAIASGKIRTVPHFGEGMEKKIAKSIAFHKKEHGRFLLGVADPIAQKIVETLKRVKGTKQVVIAGSLRRRQETIGDVDILATSDNPDLLLKTFTHLSNAMQTTGEGKTKASVRLSEGIEVDLRIVPPESFGAALQYFTGDKTHNIAVRKIAIKKHLKLSEYGLFRGKKNLASETEEEVYAALGMDCMPPEMRTASSEIEAAQAHKLPKLIEYGDLMGDLQVQTSWTDGNATIKEMADAAEKNSLSYIAITDHTRMLAMTGGLKEKDLAKQGKEIDTLNAKQKNFHILKSAEINILKDGTLDIADSALEKLDVVSIAVHSQFHMSQKEMTERIIRAMKNPYVNILFHPTGRLINRREAYAVDMTKIFRAAKQYGVAIEINGSAERLDLRDVLIREAVRLSVKLVIDSDAHAPQHFSWLDLGIAQARRGWATKKDILNTLPCDKFLETLKKMKK